MFELEKFLKKLEKGIVLIYGGAAAGKTTLCLQHSLKKSERGKVLFLDTENTFSLERLSQMDKSYKLCLDNILVVRPKSLDELKKRVETFEKISDTFNLLILDSFGIYYRLDLQKRGYIEANNAAVDILRKLRHISRKIPVIMTNQVYEDESGKKSLGGKMIQNFSDYILELQNDPKIMKLKKPEMEESNFKIVDGGLITFSSN